MAEADRQSPLSEFTLLQRVKGLGILAFLTGVFTYFSMQSARFALRDPTAPFWVRGPFFAASALLMVCALCLVAPPLHRKWKTGHFLMPRAESLAKRAEYRRRMGAGKPWWPQARFWVLPFALMLTLTGFGIFALAAAWTQCGCSRQSAVLLLVLAGVLFLLPGIFAFKAIRRKIKSGSFLPSEEELDKARAKCAEPKSLRTRILLAGIWWTSALLWTGSALHHMHRHTASSSTWLTAAMTWIPATLLTWQVFRPSQPQCALPVETDHQTPDVSGRSDFGKGLKFLSNL
jgi:hypothetical protein